jgi:hypothetical protein
MKFSGAFGTYRSEMGCLTGLAGADVALDTTQRRRCALIDLRDSDLARCPWAALVVLVDSSAAC